MIALKTLFLFFTYLQFQVAQYLRFSYAECRAILNMFYEEEEREVDYIRRKLVQVFFFLLIHDFLPNFDQFFYVSYFRIDPEQFLSFV